MFLAVMRKTLLVPMVRILEGQVTKANPAKRLVRMVGNN